VTGEPRYDKLFAELNAMLVAVEEGEREVAAVRGALARRVGLPDDAAADVLGARLRERTSRLAAEGLTLELEFTGIDDIDDRELGMDKVEPEAGEVTETLPIRIAPEEDPVEEGTPVGPTATLRTPGREPERRELRLLKVLAQAALFAGRTPERDTRRHQAEQPADGEHDREGSGHRDLLEAQEADVDVDRLGIAVCEHDRHEHQ